MDYLFWGLMLIPFAFAVAASEYESIVAGLVSIVLAAAFFYIFTDYNPLPWIVANPGTAAIYTGLYFVTGAIYSVVKWLYVVNTSTNRIKTDFERFKLNNRDDTSIEAFKKSEYNSLKVLKNKARIMGWLVWWVPSLFWTVTHDLFRKIWDHIYNMFSGLYEKIVSRKIDSTLKDF
jgi:H+/gluconate symporter-like permease